MVLVMVMGRLCLVIGQSCKNPPHLIIRQSNPFITVAGHTPLPLFQSSPLKRTQRSPLKLVLVSPIEAASEGQVKQFLWSVWFRGSLRPSMWKHWRFFFRGFVESIRSG
ncbi:uncharacterized protein LOC110686325 [Chenopodium quinoa]|uniref:uncharacterized protein LOC110686325 n=1 Tax=Chenopodium quinoa TaxID=63459 RepID=UPI000B76FBD4|nr:uncharacterized protein LOC110686325 [Chenopodium quinoa]